MKTKYFESFKCPSIKLWEKILLLFVKSNYVQAEGITTCVKILFGKYYVITWQKQEEKLKKGGE